MGDLWQLIVFLLRLTRDIRFSRLSIAFIAAAGVICGFANTAIIALINTILARGTASTPRLAAAFVTLCIVVPLFRFLSEVRLIDLSQASLVTLRLQLSRRVLGAPLRHLEKMGAPRLLATLTNDVGFLADSLARLPVLFMHIAILVSCLAYLGWLSWQVLLEIAGFMVVGVITYQLPVMRAARHFRLGREHLDAVTGQIRAMIEGTKELKMHRARRGAFLGEVEAASVSLRDENRAGLVVYAGAQAWGQVMFFVALGLLVLVLPRFQSLPTTTVIGFTLILFQMMAPLEVLLATLPALSRAAVSARKIFDLGLALEAENREPAVPAALPPSAAPDAREPAPAHALIELAAVTHSYRRENEDESFQLGPIDLQFRPGELVFLVGGNGSGKTTLAKLLLGLYAPEAGHLRFAGEVVDDSNRESYREQFSAVFADFFVFERLLGLEAEALDGEARRYLDKLHLGRKVEVADGVLSTIDLSQGQRKRLALLTAYLENRPLYLFDEWAADQDPLFKQVFYLELLPELQARGKTVFVISHDDHYFHLADRIIKMDYGRIESDLSAADLAAASATAATVAASR